MKQVQFNGWDMLGFALGMLVAGFVIGATIL